MIKLTHKNIILTITALLILFIAGCPQPDHKISSPETPSAGGDTSGGQNAGSNHNSGSGSFVPPAVENQGSISLTEKELFTLFGLKSQKGQITASAAAKKIAEKNGQTVENYTFEEARYLAYDDEKGTFTVKVKGKKDGKVFDKIFNVSGFTHPYDRQLWGVDKSDKKGELKLDAGIEDNLSVKKFIEKANADNGSNIKDFFVNTLAFSLSDGTTIVTLGETDGYKLTAQLKEEGTDKIKIVPIYTIKMHKKPADGTETVEDKPGDIGSVTTSLIRDYFKADDVFEYVLSKVKNDFVNVNPGIFASDFYAQVAALKVSPAGLLKMGEGSVFKKYKDLYAVKGENEYMALSIDAAVYTGSDPNAIEADDYAGSLGLRYCISTTDNIAPPQTDVKAISEKKEYTGFRKINETSLKDLFTFTLVKGDVDPDMTNEKLKAKWKNKYIQKKALLKGEFGSYEVMGNILAPPAKNSYHLSINGEQPQSVFALQPNQWRSKGLNDKWILLKHIYVEKKGGSDGDLELSIECYFEGNGEPITIKLSPFFGHGTP